MDDSERVYKRWVEETWNQKNEDSIDELFDENGVAHYPYFLKSEEPLRGVEKIKEFHRLVFEKFSEVHIETLNMVVEEEKVVCLCLITVVERNENSEDLLATPNAELRCLCQFKIKDGKIIELWNNVDLKEQNPKAPLLKL